ncbi:MAG TPA: hypothetical protein VMU88_02865 [bacterium]|nr:hypothetical protein [bacterium]
MILGNPLHQAMGTILAVFIFFHFPVLFQGRNFGFLDSGNFFYPLFAWGARVWGGGYLPLWNPDAALGFPSVADPETLTWYPPKILLYAILPAGEAFRWLGLAHSLWMLSGFWIWARGRGFEAWPACLGVLAFGFSYESTALLIGASALFFTASWIPWVFWSADRLGKGGRGGFLAFSLCVSLQICAGYPVYAYLTLLALGTLKLWEAFRGAPFSPWPWAGALGTALLFNAAWWLPFAERIPRSNLSARLGMGSGLGWDHLATWLNPFFCGHPLWGSHETPFMFWGFFMGLPSVALALWGGARRGTAAAFLLLFLLLSLGHSARLADGFRFLVPEYGWVVRSAYWIPLVCFAGAWAAMEGAKRLLEGEGKALFWSGLTVVLLLGALALGVPADLPSFWIAGALLLAAGWVPFAGAGRGVLLVLALLASLIPADKGFYLVFPQAFYGQTPLWAKAVPEGTRIYHWPDWMDRQEAVSGADAFEAYGQLRSSLMPNWPLADGLEEAGFNNTICSWEFLRWYYAPEEAPASGRAGILSYLNVSRLVGVEPGAGAGTRVWENRKWDPKWFPVREAHAAGSWDSDFQKMAGPHYDFARDCFVENPLRAGSYAPRDLTLERPSPNRLILRAAPGGRALLISSELAYPGWRAMVEGKGKSLEVVNHSFRGLVLESGENQAALSFEPVTVRLGLFGLLACLGIWFFLGLGLLAPGKAAHERA